MPHDCLKSFGVRSDVGGIDCRNKDADIGDFGGEAAVAADDAQNFRADSFCILQGSHQVGADIVFKIATADREHEHEIVGAQATDAQPSSRRRLPNLHRWCEP